jgi:hypothetical protein
MCSNSIPPRGECSSCHELDLGIERAAANHWSSNDERNRY